MVKSSSLRLTKSATFANMKTLVGNVNYLFICVCSVKLWEIGAVESPNIGIIGGGIGGASAAHFIRQLFGDDVTVELYEADEIGGRLRSIEVDGRMYEAGGSIIHPENFYMVNFTRNLGLTPRGSPGGRLGLYDGDEMVFLGSEWDVMLMLQFLWRYGWDIYRVLDYVKSLLANFDNIYENQENGQAFTKVESLLDSMSPDFVEMMHHSCVDDLKKYGFGETFINELVEAALRTNYGQTNKIQSFVSAVSLAGIMPGLWKVKGGNKQVPERLIDTSGIDVLKSEVTSVTKLENRFRVKASGDNETEKDSDIIIVATPLNSDISQIKFMNFQKPIGGYHQKYHRTVATFVKGWPNITNFGFDNFDDFPTEILTTNENVFFNSIGRQTAVDFVPVTDTKYGDDPVWKVFSQEPLTDSQVNFLFSSVKEKKVVDWLAYPHYESSETNIPPLKLADNIYYVNAIEMAASAMEMEVIGGRNAALLAHHEWFGKTDKIDARSGDDQKIKTEL